MQAGESEINPYLQQEVLSASPVRLRWMLINRAEELCDFVSQLWGDGDWDTANQWLLRIREILGELLDGVQDGANPLSTPVSDFYLFLLQVAYELEKNRDPDRLSILKELLGIEKETWRLVVEKLARDEEGGREAGLPAAMPDLGLTAGSNFSLEI